MPEIIVSLQHIGGTVTEGQARSHSVVIDRPADKGGDDKGPMGGELLLLALGGCFLSTFLGFARGEGHPLEEELVSLEVTGVLTPAPTRFTEVTVQVTAPAELEGEFSKQFLKAERGCIVHNSIKDAIQVVFEYRWVSRG
ncbi:putative redox protein [Lentzea fradiae]|uniref:Putative redox protein n=1 Tax=Lentzea fradiae TaxID=200378 RepID=A0A1G8CMW6_9PSEU|nr:OsmC family protein [Lentzea fradiae]SDH46180.1 putative redox protein [Lentzea fradiae]